MPQETPRRVRWEAFVAVLYAAGWCAQAQPLLAPGRSLFRADANLILVPLSVTDARGASIPGLSAENFTVLDDRRAQRIVAFYADDVPASIGIVLDVSGSTAGIFEQEKAAVRAFLDHSNPEDDYFLATVSSNPHLLADHVDDSSEIDNLLLWQKAGGGTALCDTVHFALHEARLHPRSRRVLLVISDGMDNHSRYSRQELIGEAMESDTAIHTIALADPAAGAKGLSGAERQRGLAFMGDLAQKSGGVSVRLGVDDNPRDAAARISAAVRNQYVLGYLSPDGDGTGRRHSIQVQVNLREARVHARTGYQLR